MAFLETAEMKTVSDIAVINKITNSDTTIVDNIINECIAIMSSYLSKRYDTEQIFNKTGSSRNLSVLKRLKDLVIYEIYIRHTRELNEVAQTRAAEVMNWLEKMNTGEFYDKDLPVYSTEQAPPAELRLGSNTKYQSSF